MQKILKQFGVFSIFKKDKLVIKGKRNTEIKKKIYVSNLGDHRICMSAAVFGLITGFEVNKKNFETVRTSSPSFLKIIKQLGGSFEKKNL